MSELSEGIWGPVQRGGNGRLRRVALIVAGVIALVAVVAVTVGASLYTVADRSIERVDLPALTRRVGRDQPLNVLVVGSDSRRGLTDEQIRRYNLGAFGGQRSDTIILVSVSADRRAASVVSFPRDLLVQDDGSQRKLTETFAAGPDHVVDVLQDATGVPIHHYVEVSILGFVSVVDAVGSVEICLDAPLRDRKADADFAAGCHQMGPEEALAYVRSRGTQRGDFDRMARQQTFMRAMLDRLVATRTVVDLPRLFRVVDRVASNVTTDSALGIGQMRQLADELRGLASGRIPMSTVPGYTNTIDGGSYVVPYEPGARALYGALRRGEPIQARGTPQDREGIHVAVWTGGRVAGADIVHRTLYWSSFSSDVVGAGPVDAGERTTVYVVDDPTAADRVAATLGARVAPLPPDVAAPEGADVVVAVGDDATE